MPLSQRSIPSLCKAPLPAALAIALSAFVPAKASPPDDPAAPSASQDAVSDPDGKPRASARNLDSVVVVGERYLQDYQVRRTRSATRTDTPLLDVPQAVTVITDKLAADQALTTLSETFRYMPGVGTAQGEGNRDTPVLRGISSTGDFYVDGIRDDVPYYRDLYNLERAEALKGPSAMVFGRGGSGGVINRVTRLADGMDHGGGTLQVGSGQRRRGTVDYGIGFGDGAGFRVAAVLEDSRSYRDFHRLRRNGINPSVNFNPRQDTRVILSAERFHDLRTADRGVPSFNGRPLDVDPSTFFGNPRLSDTGTDVDAFDAVVDHDFGESASLRNHARWARYGKFYQNVFPGAVDPAGTTVSLSAYRAETARRNLFNQTDLVWKASGRTIAHTLLAGLELGRQVTDNFRRTGYFAPGANIVPIDDPTSDAPVEFRQSATDADNHGVATTVGIYLQHQIEFSPRWQVVVGVRHDDFRVELRNNRTGQQLRSRDGKLSPRAGLIYKPVPQVSVYAAASKAFQPRAGEQLASLNASTASLAPESFINREVGAKWDIRRDLQASIAVYRLTRSNVAVTDPDDSTRLLLVDGQYTRGVEIGLAGRLTERWQVMGGYAWQDGEITSTQSATALAGNRLAQLPRNSASLWNRYDLNARLGVGLGIIHRGAIHANVDNAVTLPAFTRFDAAFYWTLTPSLQVQANIENLADTRYFASAHSNNNILPGAPRSAWVTVNVRF